MGGKGEKATSVIISPDSTNSDNRTISGQLWRERHDDGDCDRYRYHYGDNYSYGHVYFHRNGLCGETGGHPGIRYAEPAN